MRKKRRRGNCCGWGRFAQQVPYCWTAALPTPKQALIGCLGGAPDEFSASCGSVRRTAWYILLEVLRTTIHARTTLRSILQRTLRLRTVPALLSRCLGAAGASCGATGGGHVSGRRPPRAISAFPGAAEGPGADVPRFAPFPGWASGEVRCGAGIGTHPGPTGVQPLLSAESTADFAASSDTQAAESYLRGIPDPGFQCPMSSSCGSGSWSWRPNVGYRCLQLWE